MAVWQRMPNAPTRAKNLFRGATETLTVASGVEALDRRGDGDLEALDRRGDGTCQPAFLAASAATRFA